jgi:hypothetical protein
VTTTWRLSRALASRANLTGQEFAASVIFVASARRYRSKEIAPQSQTDGRKFMSVFGKIMGAIFGHGSAQAAGAPPASGAPPSSGASPSSSSPGATPANVPPAQTVDVAAIVDKAAATKGEKLAWRTSIVDLMKALDLDSSLAARKELAKELKYTGDTSDTATMNVWLHKQVMARLAANGGKLPADVKT